MNKIIKFITNIKFLIVLGILILFFISICLVKIYYYHNKADKYEEQMNGTIVKIDNIEDNTMTITSDNTNINNDKGGKINNYINCLNSSIDSDNLPSSINNIINEINNYYKQSNNYFAFLYKDLQTGFTVSYNASGKIFAASSIKGPKDIYIYDMASKNKLDLNTKIKYESKYVNRVAPIMNTKKVGDSFTIKELSSYSTIYSDNAAHNMLMDYIGVTTLKEYWSEKGTTTIFTGNTNWGMTCANDVAIYLTTLYDLYLNNDEYGDEIMNNFLNSTPKFLKSDYKLASKSGWAGSSIHDTAIVFDDNPYILVALSNLGTDNNYQSYFDKVSELGNKLHKAYWEEKKNICSTYY